MTAEGLSVPRRGRRRVLDRARAAVVVALGACLIAAAAVSPATGAPADPAVEPPTMGDHEPRDFRDSADDLAPDLVAAVERDLGLSAEEYLAQAAAAADASDVVEFLTEQGVDASDRRLDGTQLTIGVETAREAQLVEHTGAVAVIGSLPQPEPVDDDVVFEAATDVFGGDGITWSSPQGSFRCSSGVNGTDALGEPQLVTAGHCTSTTITGGLYRHLTFATTGVNPTLATDPQNMGAPVADSFKAGDGFDIGLVRVTEPGLTPQPYVTTYGLGQGSRTASLTAVRDTIIPTLNSPVCKSGGTTGWTCGVITKAYVEDQLVSSYKVDVFETNACMLGGDSGGPAMVGTAFVGVNSGSAFGNASGFPGTTAQYCASVAEPNRKSVMAIMRHDVVGADTIESRYGPAWEPAVLVDRPTVLVPAPHAPGASLTVSGSITNPNPRLRLHVTADGVTTIVTPDTATGQWTAALGPVGDVDSVVVQAHWGLRSTSPEVIVERDRNNGGAWTVLRQEITRIDGDDRFAVAIAIAQRAYPITTEQPARPRTVYVVNGGDYPDALSAGPAAAATGGVVMLVPTTALLPEIRDELIRLGPQHIVIVGGPASVSETVRIDMAAAVPGASVARVSGLDRFEVSRNVLQSTIDGVRVFDGADDVYVANGFNYPDALVAGAAGSSADRRAPLLTVPGPLATPLPSSTTTAIVNGGFTTIKIAGGTASVTSAIQTQLANLPGSIAYRLGGLDRYEAARTVANNAYPRTAGTVFLTTGLNFPDALAGAPLAGMLDAPMYSVQTTCVPRGVLRDLERLRPAEIILLGGTGTLTPAVFALTPCP